MPRNRLMAQIEDELAAAKASETFWRGQTMLLADTPFLETAERQVSLREAEIKQLLQAHDILRGADGA